MKTCSKLKCKKIIHFFAILWRNRTEMKRLNWKMFIWSWHDANRHFACKMWAHVIHTQKIIYNKKRRSPISPFTCSQFANRTQLIPTQIKFIHHVIIHSTYLRLHVQFVRLHSFSYAIANAPIGVRPDPADSLSQTKIKIIIFVCQFSQFVRCTAPKRITEQMARIMDRKWINSLIHRLITYY